MIVTATQRDAPPSVGKPGDVCAQVKIGRKESRALFSIPSSQIAEQLNSWKSAKW